MRKSVSKNGLILAIFAMLTSGLIALTYFATHEQIALQQQAKLQGILNAIIAPGSYDNAISNNCINVTSSEYLGSKEPQRIYRAFNNNLPVGVAIETTAPDGYSGKIQLVVGLTDDTQGNVIISGVRVLDHKETPGLGDKIDLRVNDWILSFTQVLFSPETSERFAVKKDGGQFDQFTGATISPRAVVKAVKRSALYYQQEKQAIFSAANACSLEVITRPEKN